MVCYKMRKMYKLGVSVLFSLSMCTVIGCADGNIFRNRAEDYKIVREYPPLKIPSHVKAERFSDDYEIPISEGRLGQAHR
jgi:uncharacterized lipoprotein